MYPLKWIQSSNLRFLWVISIVVRVGATITNINSGPLLINRKDYHKNKRSSGKCFEFQYEVIFEILWLHAYKTYFFPHLISPIYLHDPLDCFSLYPIIFHCTLPFLFLPFFRQIWNCFICGSLACMKKWLPGSSWRFISISFLN